MACLSGGICLVKSVLTLFKFGALYSLWGLLLLFINSSQKWPQQKPLYGAFLGSSVTMSQHTRTLSCASSRHFSSSRCFPSFSISIFSTEKCSHKREQICEKLHNIVVGLSLQNLPRRINNQPRLCFVKPFSARAAERHSAVGSLPCGFEVRVHFGYFFFSNLKKSCFMLHNL